MPCSRFAQSGTGRNGRDAEFTHQALDALAVDNPLEIQQAVADPPAAQERLVEVDLINYPRQFQLGCWRC